MLNNDILLHVFFSVWLTCELLLRVKRFWRAPSKKAREFSPKFLWKGFTERASWRRKSTGVCSTVYKNLSPGLCQKTSQKINTLFFSRKRPTPYKKRPPLFFLMLQFSEEIWTEIFSKNDEIIQHNKLFSKTYKQFYAMNISILNQICHFGSLS